MPWLVMDRVLFFHVPRCGGTSITKHHRVGQKARKGMDPYHKFGLVYYYYRYALLEHANFPLFTYENLLALAQVVTAIFVYFFGPKGLVVPYVMWSTASFTFLTSTFLWTAPVTMRNNTLRYLLMMFQSKVLCGFGGETRYMTGTTDKGYLFHITAKRAIKFGYVTEEQVSRCAFSIVRNPYSRVVSMFEYNRRPFESFEHFVQCFYKDYFDIYIGRNTSECKDIYCHILPMHEYTHINGVQVVACVIKQEHLKNLVANNWEGSNVPLEISDALTGIPHANKRARKVAWQHYYNQETMNMVYEMYRKDFEIFGYDTAIPGRPDLVLVSPGESQQGLNHEVSDVRIELHRRFGSEYARMNGSAAIRAGYDGQGESVEARAGESRRFVNGSDEEDGDPSDRLQHRQSRVSAADEADGATDGQTTEVPALLTPQNSVDIHAGDALHRELSSADVSLASRPNSVASRLDLDLEDAAVRREAAVFVLTPT